MKILQMGLNVVFSSETTQLITVMGAFAGTVVAAIFAFVQADRARRVTSSVESRKADQAEFVLIRDSYKDQLANLRTDLDDEKEARQQSEKKLQQVERDLEQERLESRTKSNQIKTLERKIRVLEDQLKKVQGDG